MSESKYPCPCCGYLMLGQSPGSYEICKICFWEDDVSQLRFVKTTGANKFSLIDAQQNFIRYGVCELRLLSYVRPPQETDEKDSDWRVIDESKDNIEESIRGVNQGDTYPEDRTSLYYWQQNYWRQ